MLRRTPAFASMAFALSMLTATDAAALAQRTFVASYGSPANTAFSCSIANPCRAFSEAIGVTTAGGEVIVQDSAGYGTVTITKSVSIIAPPGIYGGISVFSGNGIIVSNNNIKVVLRGLTINGQGGTNDGIAFANGAKLTIEDCEIANMGGNGISAFAPGSTVIVKNTVTRDNAHYGFYASGTVVATLDGVHASANESGVYALSGARVTVANSVLANNSIHGAIADGSGPTVTDVMVTRSTVIGSAYGLAAFALLGATARMVSDGNAFTVSTAFFFGNSSGTEAIYTLGNNTVVFQNAIVVGGSLTQLSTL